VIAPLRKLVLKHFWKELQVFCSGWITTYYLRLERDESIRIGIIKKQEQTYPPRSLPEE
jgi:hypothetical protein